MRKSIRLTIVRRVAIIGVLLLLGLVPNALADSKTGEEINWQFIGSGGTSGSSQNYRVSGSVGQAVAGLLPGTTYHVNQGYWQNFQTGSGCCVGTTGNVNMAGIIDLTDLSLLISYLTVSPAPVLPCPEEANVNGASIVDLTDLSLLISFLTVTPAPVLPNCP